MFRLLNSSLPQLSILLFTRKNVAHTRKTVLHLFVCYFFLQRPFMALLLAMLVADDDDDDNGVSSLHFALCEVYF